jgi:sn-glycerol 3-phosphate transport system ATP-binding protein
MGNVVLNCVKKSFGSTEVIHGITIDIKDGEFIVIVGPSGCGKSTLLRMVAGLEVISSGEVQIAGKVVNDKEPMDRNIAMVFQNYALYPHMTVKQNMGYSLKLAGHSKSEIEWKVSATADLLQLSELLERKPRQLSGGQRQRVAMGRAIVREPSVFLFDEPLSNLDAKLRVQMRLEIRQLQRQLGITSLYVTHDQVEAMTMADRMIVMNNGNAEQIGTPLEVYQKPETLFAAQFIGSPAMNIFDAEIQNGCLILNGLALTEVSLPDGKVALGIRPEHLVPSASGPIKVSLNHAERLGANTLLYGKINSSNDDITISMPGVHEISENEGDKSFVVEKANIHLFCPSSGRRL